MSVDNIRIRLELSDSGAGTRDPLYIGIITRYGGREFPLRYDRDGQNMVSGNEYQFHIEHPDRPPEERIFDSRAGGYNSLDSYPLNQVERVYLRKEPAREYRDHDDFAGIQYIGVFILEDGRVWDWSNRNRPDSSGPSPFRLGNEYGQIAYLQPE